MEKTQSARALETGRKNTGRKKNLKESARASLVCDGSLHVRCRAVVPGVLACVSYVHFVCVCAYVCMCVCVWTCICMYMHVCMYLYICALYTCVCVCVCIFVHRLWVLVSVLQRVDGVIHAHVFSCAYVCVYICMLV